MEQVNSIFPSHREWPSAFKDVNKIPLDFTSIRLISGAKNIEALPSYTSLKSLWCFDINETDLNAISECKALESLYIEIIKAESLNCLAKLTNLKILSVDTCSNIKSLDVFREFKTLSGLAITHFKNVHDLSPLSGLSNLRALGVAGSIWTRMKVKSFRPLQYLDDLEFLHLTNTKAEDESLKPLGGLKNLILLQIANFYPMGEFAWLSQQLDTTECTWFKPFNEMNLECKKCHKPSMVVLTGKRKPTLCRTCDNGKLDKHVHDWNEAINHAAKQTYAVGPGQRPCC